MAEQAPGEETPVSVQLDPAKVICQKFLGFGAEWDSNSYNDSGVTDGDFAMIRKRVEWMRVPIARIMMQSKWCYKGNGRYDWNDPQMKALYRHLDVCQRLGTTVLLTDWGIEPGWLKTPDVAKVSDYAVQAANAGSWAVLAWMLDDDSHRGFTWGMWKNRSEGLATKPWFYTWSLLSRCFPAGATIIRADLTSGDVRVLAANWDDKKSSGERSWSFCIVNRADSSRMVRMQMTGGPRLSLNRYVFSKTSAIVDKDGFPVALEKLTCNLAPGVNLVCEANSVCILSSIGDERQEVESASRR